MQSEFEMSMMGELNFFLGLQIKQTKNGIFVNQSKYCKDLIHRFGMENAKDMATPMSTACIWIVSYPNFVRGLLLDDMQPLIGRFKILGTLCFIICEVPRRAGNQKEAGLRDP